MNTEKVTEIFIGGGLALNADNTAMASVTSQTAIVGADMLTLNPAGTDTITTEPYIYLVNKLANGDLKRSNVINGTSVINFKAESFQPARRQVYGIGYHRASLVDGVTTAAGGSIIVNNSTDYEFSIRFKNDKTFYSERPEAFRVVFTSAANATQLSIATQITNLINNSSYGSQPNGIKEVIAVTVGDGTGAYGLTGATNFGVEITALTINQFQNTTYLENLVYFQVTVNPLTGFETTTVTQIQSVKRGTGTFNQVYNMENKFYGYEGVLNRTKFPIPVLAYLTSSAGFQSGAFTLTSATTTGLDVVTFSNATVATQLFPGSSVTLDGITYEIKYFQSTTVAVLTAPATSTNATGAVTAKAFYDIINIETSDVTITSGAAIGQFAKKWFVIAIPAIVVGATGNTAMTTKSAEGVDVQAILNAYMASTPLAPAAIAI